MNSINFTAKDNFPLSSDTMNMLQQMVKLNANMALLGGQNYILSGCDEYNNGTMVNDGYIVINGELLEFAGGAKQEKITIAETSQTLHAFGVDYPESYIFRTAKFSGTGEYEWKNFVQVLTNGELQQKIEAITGDTPGTVKMWAGSEANKPANYEICDGKPLQISLYPELYSIIAVSFGGDGKNNFNLPDLRGRFIVGYNSLDTDYNNVGKTGGAKEVTLETKHLPSHNHRDVTDGSFDKLSSIAADIDSSNTPASVDSVNADKEYRVAGMTSNQWKQATIKSVGGDQAHENQPPYFVLSYIIKVK